MERLSTTVAVWLVICPVSPARLNWATKKLGPPVSQGIEVMYENAIQGFQGQTGMMPAKGGFVHLSDDDVKAAIDYMVSQSQ